jgi:hypothetical protein
VTALTQHPLSAAFPAMSAEDFRALKDDIETNGQREPIIVFEGMVLDGWHRYRACDELGLKVKQFTFDASENPVAFVESANLHRRHLTASQRAAAVVAVRAWAPAKRPATSQDKKGAAAAPLSTNKEMARAANVSVRTIKDAKAGHKAGLGEAMKEGALTAEQAASIAHGKPAERQPPAAKAKRTLDNRSAEVEPQTNDDKLAEAQHTITELATENEQLQDRLAVEAMDASEHEKTQAAETIRELRALVKTLEAENAALKVSRDTYQREASEAKKSVAYWRKQAEKAGKAAKDSA